MQLQVGDPAPEFTLASSGGGEIRLHDAVRANKYVIVAFYPKDNTSG